MIAVVATAGTFPLTDGTKVEGVPESITDKGVVFQLEGGDFSPRFTWDKLTPEALKELLAETKKDTERVLLQPFMESLPQDVPKRKEIAIKPVPPPFRPKQGEGILALFSSPAGWLILLVLYGANIYAAYEVSVYRHQPVARVCGLAAIPFFGVLSPIIHGVMPTQYPPTEIVETAPVPEEASVGSQGVVVEGAAATATASAAARAGVPEAATRANVATPPTPAPAPALSEPVVFQRNDFSFNRRFFETKFAGFFRVIPSEAEKDLVLVIKAARGQFVGRRISRITPNELYLEVLKNNVSAEEMIPLAEISEVQIRHKDTL